MVCPCYENYTSANRMLVIGGVIATAVVTLGVVRINRVAYHRMKELEHT